MVRLLGEACLDCSFSFWGVVSDGKLRREFPTLLSITTEKVPPNSVYCTVGGLLQMKWDKLLSKGGPILGKNASRTLTLSAFPQILAL